MLPSSPECSRGLRGKLIAAGLLLSLGACQPPGEPAVAPVPAPPAKAESVPIVVSLDDPRMGTEVGRRTLGLGMASSGKEGWLVFGPYIPLAPGNYLVTLRGQVQPGHAGVVHFDVAHGKGSHTLAILEMEPAALAHAAPPGGTLVTLPITVSTPIPDIEVRVRVPAQANLSVAGFEIRPIP